MFQPLALYEDVQEAPDTNASGTSLVPPRVKEHSFGSSFENTGLIPLESLVTMFADPEDESAGAGRLARRKTQKTPLREKRASKVPSMLLGSSSASSWQSNCLSSPVQDANQQQQQRASVFNGSCNPKEAPICPKAPSPNLQKDFYARARCSDAAEGLKQQAPLRASRGRSGRPQTSLRQPCVTSTVHHSRTSSTTIQPPPLKRPIVLNCRSAVDVVRSVARARGQTPSQPVPVIPFYDDLLLPA